MPTTWQSTPFTEADQAMFAAAGIQLSTAAAAGWRRVTHAEAFELCGTRYKSDHLEGLAILSAGACGWLRGDLDAWLSSRHRKNESAPARTIVTRR